MSQHRVTATFLIDIPEPTDQRNASDLRDAVYARLFDECGYDDETYPYTPLDGTLSVLVAPSP